MTKPDRLPAVRANARPAVVNAISPVLASVGSKRPRERVIEVRGAHLPADALLYTLALCWALFALGGFERDVVVLLLCAGARSTGFTWWRLTLR